MPPAPAAIPLVALAALLCVCSAAGAAPRYPAKPVRLVVGQEAGSALDNSVRVITPALGAALGETIVVDNRPGLGGLIAMRTSLAAARDGHTIVSAGTPQMIAPFVFRKLDYDLLADFAPIARLTVTQNVLVANTGLGAASVPALIELAKARPGALRMGSAGPGSASHLAGSLFNTMAGVDALHVPYKGGAAAVVALLGNEVQYLLTPLAAVISHVRANRLTALGVGGDARAPQLPAVPTIDEAGLPGFRSTGWNGIFAPRGVPPAAIATITSAVTAVLAETDLREKILRSGVEPGLLTGTDYVAFMHAELKRFGAAVKAARLEQR